MAIEKTNSQVSSEEKYADNELSKRSFLKTLGLIPLGLMNPRVLAAKAEQRSSLNICFGSCQRLGYGQGHWPKIAKLNPDAWFFLGDNIYADTENMGLMKRKYNSLAAGPFKELASKSQIEGIWDDHDFGTDGANRTYSKREGSQKNFLDFLNVPQSDPRRQRAGIYYDRDFFVGSKKIKAIFLDCRYHKDPEKGSRFTMLGLDQWKWLENTLMNSDADAHIFVSSIGVLLNRLFVTEDWSEYPTDRAKLFELIDRYNAKGSFFLSGDKHFGAMIKRNEYGPKRGRQTYYEFQSSGLTHRPRKKVQKLIPLMYGRSNVLVEKNFAQMEFFESNGQLNMRWHLYTLESTQANVKMSRDFILNDQLWKRIK